VYPGSTAASTSRIDSYPVVIARSISPSALTPSGVSSVSSAAVKNVVGGSWC